MSSIEAKIMKAARSRVGERPDGHSDNCQCKACVELEARAQIEAERIAKEALTDLHELREAEERYEQYLDRRETVAKARQVAAGAAAVRGRLRVNLEGSLRRAAELVEQAGEERMTADQFKHFQRASTRAAELAERDRALEGLESRAVAVVNESRVYGPESPSSWYLDLALCADISNPVVSGEARKRQARYAQELAYEARRGSAEGRRVVRALHERARCELEHIHREAESRSGIGSDGGISATAAGEAAAFVSPYFIEAAWAPFRGRNRSFADQLGTYPMPAYGMKIYVPYFSTGTSAGEVTEGQAPAESSPMTALQTAQLQLVSGQVIVSQAMHDRALKGGGQFDVVIGKQIKQQLDEAIDLYCLNQAITNGKSVAGQTSYSTKGLYQDLASGREELTDTAGTRLRPTHFFSTSDLYSYATRQVDNQERPIVVPQFAAGFPLAAGADDGLQGDQERPKWSRFTGTVLPGGVLWFEDDNIPTVGTTNKTQLIVSAPAEALTLTESDEPMLTVFPETEAVTLRVLVNLRSYIACITRHAAGTAAVSSAAYTTALV